MGLRAIGRDEELAAFRGALNDRPASTFAVTGRSGVGKSHVVRAVLEGAVEDGWEADLVHATGSARTIPFGALAHLLPLPEPGPMDQLPYLQSALDHIVQRALERRVLIAVDDAHLLDPGSATLMRQLAETGTVALMISVRTGEPMPDAVQQLVAVAEPNIRIRPLSRSHTRELAEAVLDGPATERLHAALWRMSDGNPLYLRELLLDAIEGGAVEKENGIWALRQPLGTGDRLVEVITSRMHRLPDGERAVAEILALAEPLETDLLLDHVEVASIDGLVRRGIARTVRLQSRRVSRLEHPAHREVLRHQMSEPRVRELSGMLARSLERRGTRRREDLLRLATWHLDAGATERPDVLIEGARWALALFDHPLAERLARAATPPGDAEAFRLLGDSLSHQQRIEEADHAFDEAERLAADDAQRLEVVRSRAEHLFLRAGRTDEARALVRAALDRPTDAVDAQDVLTGTEAVFAAIQGDLHGASKAGERMLQREDPSPRALVATLFVSTLADAMLGNFEASRRGVEVALRCVDEVGTDLPMAEDVLRVNRAGADLWAGQLHRTEALAARGRSEAFDRGAQDVAGVWSWLYCEALLLRGRVSEAHRVVIETLPVVGERDPLNILPSLVATGATLSAMTAAGPDTELVARFRSFPPIPDARLQALSARCRAWLDLRRLGVRRGAEAAVTAGEVARTQTQLAWAAQCYHDAVRFGFPDVAADVLAELAEQMEGELVPTFAAHGLALRDRDPDGLEECSRRFEVLGADLYAAEAAAHAARIHRSDDARRSRRAASRATLLAERCAEAYSPALFGLGGEPLSPRELEVAQLAAAGHASKTIAERLSLSPRTVDNYLGAAYRKLGVSGRQELAEVLSSSTGG